MPQGASRKDIGCARRGEVAGENHGVCSLAGAHIHGDSGLVAAAAAAHQPQPVHDFERIGQGVGGQKDSVPAGVDSEVVSNGLQVDQHGVRHNVVGAEGIAIEFTGVARLQRAVGQDGLLRAQRLHHDTDVRLGNIMSGENPLKPVRQLRGTGGPANAGQQEERRPHAHGPPLCRSPAHKGSEGRIGPDTIVPVEARSRHCHDPESPRIDLL